MDDSFKACAEACEAQGFARQADLFRDLAGGKCRVYAVMNNKQGFHLDSDSEIGGDPVAVFLDPASAEREAFRLNVRAFRDGTLLRSCFHDWVAGFYLDEVTELDADELSERVGEILGAEYAFPREQDAPLPTFPAEATDDQMREILGLFRQRFFYAASVEWTP